MTELLKAKLDAVRAAIDVGFPIPHLHRLWKDVREQALIDNEELAFDEADRHITVLENYYAYLN